jgi:plastocyanin
MSRLGIAGAFTAAAMTAGLVFGIGLAPSGAQPPSHPQHIVNIPDTDKFVPFQMTVHVGDKVTWINSDTDDHTVVSDDAFDTVGLDGLEHLIPGTDNNNGQPGTFTVQFNHAGTFVYYCMFHSMLDGDNQPIAPGPRGGITDANGNFGTPMSGVITVVNNDNNNDQ